MTISHDVFGRGQSLLELAYPRAGKLTGPQVMLWLEMLDDLDDLQYMTAIRDLIQHGDDWPSIAKVRSAATGSSGIGYGERAARSWLAVRAAIKSYGYSRTVEFDDPITNACVRAVFGGWVELCSLKSHQISDRQYRWDRDYAALSATGVTHEAAAALGGEFCGEEGDEVVRIETGLATDDTIRISGPRPRQMALPGPRPATRSRGVEFAAGLAEQMKQTEDGFDEQRKAAAVAERQEMKDAKAAAISGLMDSLDEGNE